MSMIYDSKQYEVRSIDGSTYLPGIYAFKPESQDNSTFAWLKSKSISYFIKTFVPLAADTPIVYEYCYTIIASKLMTNITWLVRVKDMCMVPAAEVKRPYWILSYSPDRLTLNDGQTHRTTTIPHPTDKEQLDLEFSETVDVDSEKLIQQICKDFKIDYYWRHAQCHKSDAASSLSSVDKFITNHIIHESASGVLILVPEMRRDDNGIVNLDAIAKTLWSTDPSVIETASRLRNILFVGENAHLYSKTIPIFGATQDTAKQFLLSVCQDKTWTASTSLRYTRGIKSDSGNTQDRILMLCDKFPNTFTNTIQFEDLLLGNPLLKAIKYSLSDFYKILAMDDPSVLYFGVPIDDRFQEVPPSAIDGKPLPSWTGKDGIHIDQNWIKSVDIKTLSYPTIDESLILHMNTESIQAFVKMSDALKRSQNITDLSLYTQDGLPYKLPQWVDDDDYIKPRYTSNLAALTIVAVPTESSEMYDQYTRACGLKATHFLPLKQKKGRTFNTLSKPTYIGGVLSLTEYCDECFIILDPLFGIDFLGRTFLAHMVLATIRKRNEVCYKHIGLSFISSELVFDSSVITDSREFKIK